MTHDVYEASCAGYVALFSDGVTREFGANKIVTLDDGETIFCSVMPLSVNPAECGMKKIGTIEA